MTELEQLLSKALASQSEQVASLAERLNDLTELLLIVQERQELLTGRVDHLTDVGSESPWRFRG